TADTDELEARGSDPPVQSELYGGLPVLSEGCSDQRDGECREQQLDDLGHLKLPLWRFHHAPCSGRGAPLRTRVGRLRHAAVRSPRARRLLLTKMVLRSLSSRYTAPKGLLTDRPCSRSSTSLALLPVRDPDVLDAHRPTQELAALRLLLVVPVAALAVVHPGRL